MNVFAIAEMTAKLYNEEGYEAAIAYNESLANIDDRIVSTAVIGACQTTIASEMARAKKRLDDAIARCIEVPSDDSIYLESGVRG